MKYQVYSYDVWGNKQDGYEVNDVYPTTFEIEIDDNTTDKQIIKQLKKEGFINKYLRNKSLDVDGADTGSYFYVDYNITSYPLCELRPKL